MISLDGVDQIFHTPRPIHVLKDIHLDIAQNEIYGILGRLGAGKTSLMRCLNLLDVPSRGNIYVDGTNLLTLSEKKLQQMRRTIGFFTAPYDLLATKTIYKNIALPLEIASTPKKEIQQTVDYLLLTLGLSDKKDAFPKELSAIQKKRTCLARALAQKPKILICDEPTLGLDPKNAQTLLRLLKDLQEAFGLTIIITTQDMDVVKSICDKVAVLNQGEITEQGSVLELFSDPKSEPGKEFVKSASRLDLPSALRKKLRPQQKDGMHPIFRVSFLGRSAQEALIAHVIQGLGLIVNITQAHLETIQGQIMGIMILEMKGKLESIERATQFLSDKGLHIEVLGYVSDTA